MDKKEVVGAISKTTQLEKDKSEKILDDILETIVSTLKDGQSVQLLGFGKFSIQERKARAGKNTLKGKSIQIEDSKIPVFTPGKELKDAVKKKNH